MPSQKVLFLAFILIFKYTEGKLDKCKFGKSFPNGTYLPVDLREIENNFPRKDEIIRTKVYLNHHLPVISVSGSSYQITFGKY